jgi:membrane protein YdbS with pleckstrin-like domain
MNTEKATKKTANLLYTLCAAMLVWIGVIAIGVFWAWVFDGEQSALRNVLLFPFTMVGIYTTIWIWKHYR